jgi:hypothetical protein
MAIYQELVEMFGFAHRYNSVKRFVRCLKEEDPHQFDRLEDPPRIESQVDLATPPLTTAVSTAWPVF